MEQVANSSVLTELASRVSGFEAFILLFLFGLAIILFFVLREVVKIINAREQTAHERTAAMTELKAEQQAQKKEIDVLKQDVKDGIKMFWKIDGDIRVLNTTLNNLSDYIKGKNLQ